MNSSDLMIGLYLIIMSSVDIIFGDNYVEIDLVIEIKFAMLCIMFCFTVSYTHISFFSY